jgi:5'-deoxynucleotidase YfbR-like HD superfamily hydrolase
MFAPIDLSGFPKEREKRLKSIYRYNAFPVMYYRSHLWLHAHRVLWLLEELIPLAKKHIDFDVEKARILALVHDDAEIITGDIPAGYKNRMSKQETANLEKDEEAAIKILIKKHPRKIHGYSYEKLLYHALRKDCIEAKLVSYVDKLDAHCESLHELFAGNISFLRSVMFYDNMLILMGSKYPELQKLLSSKESPLTYLQDRYSHTDYSIEKYLNLNKPFTKASINKPTDFPFYNLWRKLVLEKAGKDGVQWLTRQREFLPK